MRTTCQTIDTRWGSDNHPHYSHGNTLPLYRSPFWDELLPSSDDTRTRGLVFQPQSPYFSGISSHPPA